MFKVKKTNEYLEATKRWSTEEKRRADRVIKKLAINPYVGKRIYPFLWENKIKDKRIYYTIREDKVIVFVVRASGKKDQQKKIDKIKTKFLNIKGFLCFLLQILYP